MSAKLSVILGCLLLTACGTHRYFAPRENSNGTGPSGMPAAVYPLVAQDGRSAGEVRLWSNGAFRRDEAGGEVTRLHIGFELENGGTDPMQMLMENVRVTNLAEEGQEGPATTAPLLPVKVEGLGEAAPGGTTRVDFEFDPGELMPRSIAAFEVTWSAESKGETFRQVTPFLPFFPEPTYWDHGPWYGFHPGWRRYCW